MKNIETEIRFINHKNWEYTEAIKKKFVERNNLTHEKETKSNLLKDNKRFFTREMSALSTEQKKDQNLSNEAQREALFFERNYDLIREIDAFTEQIRGIDADIEEFRAKQKQIEFEQRSFDIILRAREVATRELSNMLKEVELKETFKNPFSFEGMLPKLSKEDVEKSTSPTIQEMAKFSNELDEVIKETKEIIEKSNEKTKVPRRLIAEVDPIDPNEAVRLDEKFFETAVRPNVIPEPTPNAIPVYKPSAIVSPPPEKATLRTQSTKEDWLQ